MSWVLVDVLIGVLAVGVLLGVSYGLYRHVRALMKTVGKASKRIGGVTAEIEQRQRQGADARTP